MRPGEVLDAQGDLLERLEGEAFQRYIHNAGDPDNPAFSDGPLLSRAINMLRAGVRAAYAYKVSADLSLLVEHAANGLDSLDRFDSSLAPTGCGFVSFDRPIEIIDIRGRKMLLHFLVWGPGRLEGTDKHVTVVWTFNDLYRQPDEVWEEFHEMALAGEDGAKVWERYEHLAGRWAMIAFNGFVDGGRMGPQLQVAPPGQVARLKEDGFSPEDENRVNGTNLSRLLHALWLMLNQTIVRVQEERPDRPSRRRAAKYSLRGSVTVVRLRREEFVGSKDRLEESEAERVYRYRWITRGHWRWQHVSAAHPCAQEVAPDDYRARIWINPYEKGPEGAPLLHREKVYSLDR